MKKISSILFVLVSLLCFTSCSEESLPYYDTEYKALNIWFGSTNTVNDNAVHNYSYAVTERPIEFQARVLGPVVDYDRSFSLEAVEGDTALAAGSYRFEKYVIPAGETTGTFKIYFDTSKLTNAKAFTENEGSITFRMKANDEFAVGANRMNSLTVVLRNYLAKPDMWDGNGTSNYEYYFGPYSKVKYQFMIEACGLIDFKISFGAAKTYDPETNTVNYNYAKYLADLFKQELAKYNEEQGSPLLDENGEPVQFK